MIVLSLPTQKSILGMYWLPMDGIARQLLTVTTQFADYYTYKNNEISIVKYLMYLLLFKLMNIAEGYIS